MLEFTEKLTLFPSAMTQDDVAGLRAHGFSDRDILSIVLAAAYRNFITRITDSLGVELSPTGKYEESILKAFGVSADELATTIYGDRALARNIPEDIHRPQQRIIVRASETDDMCWIGTQPQDGDARLAERCTELGRLTQPYPLWHLGLALSLRPDALQATIEMWRQVSLGGSGLGRRLEATIGLMTSLNAGVSYTATYHAQAFLKAGGSFAELQTLVQDPSLGELDSLTRGVARFCEKVTLVPRDMAMEDLQTLRSVGLDDRSILTVASGAAVQAYLDRVVAGLGIQPEDQAASDAVFKPLRALGVL
jgi:uncharacterized peroxidase-related enzyme